MTNFESVMFKYYVSKIPYFPPLRKFETYSLTDLESTKLIQKDFNDCQNFENLSVNLSTVTANCL